MDDDNLVCGHRVIAVCFISEMTHKLSSGVLNPADSTTVVLF